MTFQQLQYLLEVYRAGSISQAAKNLFVGQSSVSISISSLEAELGYPIFTRSKYGTHPTPKGMSVIEHASRICESYRCITGPDSNAVTNLRIGSASYPSVYNAFVRLVEENRERNNITFSMYSQSITELTEKVSLFELDIGICFVLAPRIRSVEARLRKKGLQWKVLKEIPVTIHIGPGHRLYNKPIITPHDLENDMLIDTTRKEVAQSTFLNGIIPFSANRVISVYSPDLRRELIHRGLGYSIGQTLPIQSNQQYSLRSIPLEGVNFKLVVMTNPLRSPIPEIERFLTLLDEELENS